jgi:hypothetical protein
MGYFVDGVIDEMDEIWSEGVECGVMKELEWMERIGCFPIYMIVCPLRAHDADELARLMGFFSGLIGRYGVKDVVLYNGHVKIIFR